MSAQNDILLGRIEEVLAAHEPVEIPLERASRRAAVAVVLREGELGPEVLLMQRTTRDSDRWSGQVSFPGGREEDHDETLIATAMRETREEVSVDLERAGRLIGQLDAIQARNRSGWTNLSVWPFVFSATDSLAPQPSEEAEAVFWLPLRLAASGRIDDEYEFRLGRGTMTLPCWRYQERIVWGMTHMMVRSFLELIK